MHTEFCSPVIRERLASRPRIILNAENWRFAKGKLCIILIKGSGRFGEPNFRARSPSM